MRGDDASTSSWCFLFLYSITMDLQFIPFPIKGVVTEENGYARINGLRIFKVCAMISKGKVHNYLDAVTTSEISLGEKDWNGYLSSVVFNDGAWSEIVYVLNID